MQVDLGVAAGDTIPSPHLSAADLRFALVAKNGELAAMDAEMAAKDAIILAKDAIILAKDDAIRSKDALVDRYERILGIRK
jgi:hypothetical protein